MRKMLITIGILLTIFVGMVIHKVTVVKKEQSQVSAGDVEKIQEYIEKIYLWKEVTNEALPVFDDINQADSKWIWEVVKNNLDDYSISYDDANKKVKELFGQECNVQLPKEGNDSFVYNEKTEKYDATNVELDNKQDSFLIDDITKTDDGFCVGIIEYLVNHENENNEIIENTNEEKIETVEISNDSDLKIHEIVKNNKDKFSKKTIYLKNENNSLVVTKVTK